MMSRLPIVTASLIVLCACTTSEQRPADTATLSDTAAAPVAAPPADSGAVYAVMRDSTGRELGTLYVRESEEGLIVAGTLRGVAPGVHGIHLHTTGNCEPTFDAAGGHWNPTDRKHGVDTPAGAHLGDLRNIEVAADSSANVSTIAPGGTLRGANPLLDADGATIVLHAGPDDNRTDPSGNSGTRVACGRVMG